jgi:PDZ domain-containing protein
MHWHPVWPVLGVLLVVSGTVLGAMTMVRGHGNPLVPAPYVVYAPGSAIETEPAIKTPGTRGYEDEGEVLFLTVSVRGASRRVGYAEAAYGWIRGDQDVFPRDLILGDQTGEENRQEALQEMADSQDVAAKVALDHLGYDVPTLVTGHIVTRVDEGSPAQRVLRPGDVIVAADGKPIDDDEVLGDAVEAKSPGDEVTLDVERGGETVTVRTELIEDPDDPSRTIIGIFLATRITYDFPFPVRIDTRDVGGPSAGLALTLGLIDHLTPGSLTGGNVVATTGTVDTEGRVGEVGGVGQKAVAARGADVDLMLVPAAEAEDARQFAGDMKVVGVRTLDDALDALADVGGNAHELDRSGG